jgi:hypothetical protein
MNIQMTNGDISLTATLLDNPTAHDFASMLPLTVQLSDYASTEKIADLPRPLTTEAAPNGTSAAAGDITLYAPWGNLAIFYRDFGYADGLIKIGTITTGTDQLTALEGAVVIERSGRA